MQFSPLLILALGGCTIATPAVFRRQTTVCASGTPQCCDVNILGIADLDCSTRMSFLTQPSPSSSPSLSLSLVMRIKWRGMNIRCWRCTHKQLQRSQRPSATSPPSVLILGKLICVATFRSWSRDCCVASRFEFVKRMWTAGFLPFLPWIVLYSVVECLVGVYLYCL